MNESEFRRRLLQELNRLNRNISNLTDAIREAAIEITLDGVNDVDEVAQLPDEIS